MPLNTLIANYARFNLWANETLVQWIRTKPEADFSRLVPSSYPSIESALNHIWESERFWYRVVTGVEKPYDPSEPRASLEPAAVFARLVEQSAQLAEFAANASDASLAEAVTLDSPWVKGIMPRYEFLQHVFNHGTYHRGQLVGIGRNLGYTDAPMTDYNFYNMAVSRRGI